MKKLLMVALLALSLPAWAMEIGVVNFRKILEESKVGIEEQKGLEAMKNQMAASVEQLERQLSNLSSKLQDPDYRDSLSPEAEEEMMMKGQRMAMEMQQQREQFMQVMGQAEYKLIHELTIHIMRASQVVARKKGFDLVIRDDASFFFKPSMDLTEEVLDELDRQHAKER